MIQPDEIVAWMRSKGVIQAKFVDGQLTECVLGPPPPDPAPENMAPPKAEREESPEEKKRTHEELLFGAA